MTKPGELYNHLEVLRRVLHPDLGDKLEMMVNQAIAEVKKENISKDLQELEPLLLRYRENYKIFAEANVDKGIKNLWMKPIIKKIDELYGKENKN